MDNQKKKSRVNHYIAKINDVSEANALDRMEKAWALRRKGYSYAQISSELQINVKVAYEYTRKGFDMVRAKIEKRARQEMEEQVEQYDELSCVTRCRREMVPDQRVCTECGRYVDEFGDSIIGMLCLTPKMSHAHYTETINSQSNMNKPESIDSTPSIGVGSIVLLGSVGSSVAVSISRLSRDSIIKISIRSTAGTVEVAMTPEDFAMCITGLSEAPGKILRTTHRAMPNAKDEPRPL
jgi:hypothetical protein